MLRLLATLTLVLCTLHTARAEQLPHLLTYSQLMMLSPSKRLAYMNEITKLLVMLERQQAKYELADGRLDEMKSQVAQLMQELKLLPEAGAEEDVQSEEPPDKWPAVPDKAKPKPNIRRSLKPAASPDGGGSAEGPAPATGGAPSDKRIEDSAKPAGEGPTSLKPETPGPALGGGGDEGKAPDNSSQPASDSCTEASKLTPAQHDDLVNRFRNSAGKGSCVRGGFFSKYDNGIYRSKHCVAPRTSFGGRCPANKSLCNPVLFCYGVSTDYPLLDQEKKPTGINKFYPGHVCATVNQHFTENCEMELQAALKKPLVLPIKNWLKASKGDAKKQAMYTKFNKDYSGKPTAQCNLEAVSGFKEKYGDLIKGTEEGYERLCGGTAEFRALFCRECSIIGSHINKANTRALAGAPTPPPAEEPAAPGAPAAPPSQPPAATDK